MACAIAFNNLPAIRALLKSGREVEGKIIELEERFAYPYWNCYTPLGLPRILAIWGLFEF